MALKDITVPTKEIAVGANSFEVKGFSVDNLASLVARFGDELTELFDQITEKAEGEEISASNLMVYALEHAPDIVAATIALAAGEQGEADKVRDLPAPVQLDALMAIFELTFHSEGDVKKFIETVTTMLSGTARLVSVSDNGDGDSGAK